MSMLKSKEINEADSILYFLLFIIRFIRKKNLSLIAYIAILQLRIICRHSREFLKIFTFTKLAKYLNHCK